MLATSYEKGLFTFLQIFEDPIMSIEMICFLDYMSLIFKTCPLIFALLLL